VPMTRLSTSSSHAIRGKRCRIRDARPPKAQKNDIGRCAPTEGRVRAPSPERLVARQIQHVDRAGDANGDNEFVPDGPGTWARAGNESWRRCPSPLPARPVAGARRCRWGTHGSDTWSACPAWAYIPAPKHLLSRVAPPGRQRSGEPRQIGQPLTGPASGINLPLTCS
jgi:hypothetical protein